LIELSTARIAKIMGSFCHLAMRSSQLLFQMQMTRQKHHLTSALYRKRYFFRPIAVRIKAAVFAAAPIPSNISDLAAPKNPFKTY